MNENQIGREIMGRPKNLSGVNRYCRTCIKDCKQSKNMEVVYCPSYQAMATPEGIERAADKALMVSRPDRLRARARELGIKS